MRHRVARLNPRTVRKTDSGVRESCSRESSSSLVPVGMGRHLTRAIYNILRDFAEKSRDEEDFDRAGRASPPHEAGLQYQ